MTDTTRQFKDAIYRQLARIGKSLASAPRLEILDILCQGPRTVEVLAKQVNQSIANTSHHLQVLRRARLIKAQKEGVHVTYRLADDEVCVFFHALRRLAEARLLEIEEVTHQFLEARGVMEPIDRKILVERVRSGAVTVLDVRPIEEYNAGHLPGAISVPLGELERRLDELPRERGIVAYCRGPYCVLAMEAVELLRSHGYEAERLEDGVHDWKARGFQISGSAKNP